MDLQEPPRKKFELPKLKSRKDSTDSSFLSFLDNIKTSKQPETVPKEPEAVLDTLLTNLTIETNKKEALDIDLSSALRHPRNFHKSATNSQVIDDDNEVILFENLFIDCDDEVAAPKVENILVRKTDLSKIRKYKSDLMAKDRSAFAKIACGRFRLKTPPKYNFVAFRRPGSSVVPFNFKTLSPDDIVSLRLHGK